MNSAQRIGSQDGVMCYDLPESDGPLVYLPIKTYLVCVNDTVPGICVVTEVQVEVHDVPPAVVMVPEPQESTPSELVCVPGAHAPPEVPLDVGGFHPVYGASSSCVFGGGCAAVLPTSGPVVCGVRQFLG